MQLLIKTTGKALFRQMFSSHSPAWFLSTSYPDLSNSNQNYIHRHVCYKFCKWSHASNLHKYIMPHIYWGKKKSIQVCFLDCCWKWFIQQHTVSTKITFGINYRQGIRTSFLINLPKIFHPLSIVQKLGCFGQIVSVAGQFSLSTGIMPGVFIFSQCFSL